MEILDKFLSYAHIIAGALSLLTGYGIFFFKKGGAIHKKLGKFYVQGMIASFATAVLIMLLFRFNMFLMVIAVFSFFLSVTGYRVINGKKRTQPNLGDWLFTGLITLAALGFTGYGIICFIAGAYVMCGLQLFFGLVAGLSARSEWKIQLNRADLPKNWWIRYHITGMIASMIAATTAFVVNIGPRLLDAGSFSWIFWVLPTIIGTFIISHWTKKYTKS